MYDDDAQEEDHNPSLLGGDPGAWIVGVDPWQQKQRETTIRCRNFLAQSQHLPKLSPIIVNCCYIVNLDDTFTQKPNAFQLVMLCQESGIRIG